MTSNFKNILPLAILNILIFGTHFCSHADSERFFFPGNTHLLAPASRTEVGFTEGNWITQVGFHLKDIKTFNDLTQDKRASIRIQSFRLRDSQGIMMIPKMFSLNIKHNDTGKVESVGMTFLKVDLHGRKRDKLGNREKAHGKELIYVEFDPTGNLLFMSRSKGYAYSRLIEIENVSNQIKRLLEGEQVYFPDWFFMTDQHGASEKQLMLLRYAFRKENVPRTPQTYLSLFNDYPGIQGLSQEMIENIRNTLRTIPVKAYHPEELIYTLESLENLEDRVFQTLKIFITSILPLSREEYQTLLSEESQYLFADRKMIFGGDIFDRGNDVIGTFQAVVEAVKKNMGEVILGNHDLAPFYAVQKLHLPFQESFSGVPANYHITLDNQTFSVYEEWKKLFARDRRTRNSMYWSVLTMKNQQRAAKNQKLYWNGSFERISSAFEDFYFSEHNKFNPNKIFSRKHVESEQVIRDFFGGNEKLSQWWALILGRKNNEIDAYTGFKAGSEMSLLWWEERLKEMEIFFSDTKYQQGKGKQLKLLLKDEISNLLAREQTFFNEITDPFEKTTYLMVDAINYRNYESVQWYAKDWIYHGINKIDEIISGRAWGPSAIFQLAREKLSGFDAPWGDDTDYNPYQEYYYPEGHEHEGSIIPNASNFYEHQFFKDVNRFFSDNFNLYRRIPYGALIMHAFPPVVEDIESQNQTEYVIGFEFKGTFYSGKTFFDGLDLLEKTVQDEDSKLEDRVEALQIIQSWYADLTTTSKPKFLKKYIENGGAERLLSQIGVRMGMFGHNPTDKLAAAGIPQTVLNDDLQPVAIFADHSMGYHYGGRGLFWTQGADGMYASGFNGMQGINSDSHFKEMSDLKFWDHEEYDASRGVSLPSYVQPRTDYLSRILKDLQLEARELNLLLGQIVYPEAFDWNNHSIAASA